VLGEPYADADGTRYLRLFGQPVLVMEGDKTVVAAVRDRAARRGVPTAVFTSDMLVGVAVHGQRNAVDKIVKGAALHR
jgi:hypothetical protein